MAKRKTIRVNPLDTLVPDPTTRQTGKSATAATAQSLDPVTGSTRAATLVAQPPSSTDLVSRLQSLENQNEYIKWLAVGAILLWIML